jgi:hypothetical protein
MLVLSDSTYTAIDKIDKTIAGMIAPDVGGVQVASIADQNIDTDGAGNIAIIPNILKDSIQIGVTHPALLRRHPTTYQLQYSNDEGVTWFDIGTGGGGGDMLKATYDAPNNGYVERAGMLVDGGGNLDAAGIRALIPAAGADPRIQEITAFFALVRGFLATSTTGFLQLPGGIIDAFLSTDANISTGANYQLTSGLTQIDPDVEMSVDLVPIYVSGTPTKGTLMLMYGGDVSKFGLAYTWGGDWFYVNGAGDGLIRPFSTGADTLNILYRTFDLDGTVAETVTPRLYVYELAGTFQILGAQLVLW